MNQFEKVFDFNGSNIRVIIRNGESWFIAKDICEILGFRMASDMTRVLDGDEKDTHTVRTLGGNQKTTIINEPGVYSAIMRSRKPEAKQFKRWVTHEVLPSIRINELTMRLENKNYSTTTCSKKPSLTAGLRICMIYIKYVLITIRKTKFVWIINDHPKTEDRTKRSLLQIRELK
ncbi:Bro-N domain-containing protein [Bacillus swezeyi]|uniref:BRO-N domain-containing protein n=1 Tax=Bacillus swezeyi TaxID=1925020 RepID=UPI0039C636E6